MSRLRSLLPAITIAILSACNHGAQPLPAQQPVKAGMQVMCPTCKPGDCVAVSPAGKYVPAPCSVYPAKAKPSNPFQALQAYAKPRGIRWRIFCTSDDKESYVGWAIQPGAAYALYYEDGGRTYWLTEYYPDRESAAKRLLVLLHGSPDRQPEYRGQEKPQRKPRCLAPITSENVDTKPRCKECDQ